MTIYWTFVPDQQTPVVGISGKRMLPIRFSVVQDILKHSFETVHHLQWNRDAIFFDNQNWIEEEFQNEGVIGNEVFVIYPGWVNFFLHFLKKLSGRIIHPFTRFFKKRAGGGNKD